MKRGGAINRFPSVGKEIPAPPNVGPDRYPKVLETRVGIYSVTGHGGLLPSEIPNVFIVPENTWVMFIARAGDKLRKVRDDEPILNDFRYLREGETMDQWYTRINQAMQEGTLLKDMLYSKQSPDKSGIYEPGDLVNDMSISIRNTSPPWGPMGIWKLPLRRDHLAKLKELNDSLETEKDQFVNKILQKPEVVTIIKTWKQKYPQQPDVLETSIRYFFLSEDKKFDDYVGKLSMMAQTDVMFMVTEIGKLSSIDEEIQNISKNKDDVFLNWGSTNGIDLNLFTQTKESKNFQNKQNYILLSSILRNNEVFPYAIPHPNIAYGKPAPAGKEKIPMYRIFVIESCRPTPEPGPQAKKLVRTMSNATREDYESCPVPRTLTNKRTLQQYASENPVIKSLIEGDSKKFTEIQPVLEKIKGAPLLEQQFLPDDVVTIQGISNINSNIGLSSGLNPSLNNTKGVVLRKEGDKYVIFSEETGDEVRVPASNITKGGRRYKTYRKKKFRRQTRKRI